MAGAPGVARGVIPFVELKSQFAALEPEVRDAIDGVLTRAWFVFGEEHAAFEREFADYVGVRHAVAVGSGTDAIALALEAAGLESGGTVITAANTCVPTAAGIHAAGGALALADVDSATLTLDSGALEAAITPETQAVVPVHLYGRPCDMDAVCAVAARHGLIVVEDCAQAHGTRYRGQMCGVFGKAAAFSFYPSKNLGAYGDGGAVVTNDAEVAERVRMLRNYGETERYYHAVKGRNSRLDELQAAVLRVKLRHLDAWNDARRARAAAYREGLAGLPVALPAEADWARSNYHLFVIRTPDRDALRAHLTAQGIGTQLHYPVPLHRQEAFAGLGLAEGALPEAERACREVISLPMYPELPLDSVERVAEAVRAFFG